MTTRPIPARVASRRTWAMPFARGTGRAVVASGRGDASQARPQALPPQPPSADEDFLRRLREAGL